MQPKLFPSKKIGVWRHWDPLPGEAEFDVSVSPGHMFSQRGGLVEMSSGVRCNDEIVLSLDNGLTKVCIVC